MPVTRNTRVRVEHEGDDDEHHVGAGQRDGVVKDAALQAGATAAYNRSKPTKTRKPTAVLVAPTRRNATCWSRMRRSNQPEPVAFGSLVPPGLAALLITRHAGSSSPKVRAQAAGEVISATAS